VWKRDGAYTVAELTSILHCPKSLKKFGCPEKAKSGGLFAFSGQPNFFSSHVFVFDLAIQ
jgi:hypothetical protein